MQILKKAWRPLLALILLAVLVVKGPFDLAQLKSILIQPKVIFLGLAVFFMQILVISYRWKLFVDLVAKINFFKTVQLTLIGLFFNFFIPGGVGGDIVKAIELSKNKTTTRSQALSTVMSDRVFGLFAMISFATIFLAAEYWTSPSDYIFKIGSTSLFIFAGITVALLFLPVIFSKISGILSSKDSKILFKVEKLVNSLHFTFLTFRNVKVQVKSYTASFISQAISIYFLYAVVQAAGITPPSFLVFFSLCCFGFVAAAIPIMPGGVGVGQYAFYILFAHINEELGRAAITAITTLQIFTLVYALLGGLIFSLNPGTKAKIDEYEKAHPTD